MADNLKNIEDALGKIKSDTGSIKETIGDDFHAKIGAINNSILRVAQGIANLETDSAATPSSISADVDWTKFEQGLAKFDKNLKDYSKAVAEPVKKLNNSIVEANKFLKSISDHITSQTITGTTTQQSQSNGGNGSSSGNTNNIHSTVKSILKVLEDIRDGKSMSSSGSTTTTKTGKGKDRDDEKSKISIIGALHSIESIGTSLISSDKFTTDKAADIVSGFAKNFGPVGGFIGGIIDAVKTAFDTAAKEQRSASDFSRQIGGGRSGMYNVQQTARSVISSERAKRLGYTVDEAYSAITSVSESLGRTAEKLSRQDLESAINLRRFGVGGQEINNFDTFGKSLQETDRFFTRLYSDVSKKGLSFKNVSKAVNDNLKMAQTHTFANGLRGLAAMAEKAVQLKYNMQQVAAFSDKVSTVEGALQAGANLSVLGGTFAQYADPMQLLYESLNDQEAMNERMIEMFGKSAFWDSTRGEFSMAPEDRLRLKAAAQAAGLNPNEMMNLAYNNARVGKVETQIGSGVDKDTAEYIKNIAALDKRGQAYVMLNGQRRNVGDLTASDKAALQRESEKKELSENADLGSIYSETMSIGEKLDNILTFLQQKIYIALFKGLDFLSGGYLGGIEKIQNAARDKGWSQEYLNSRIEKYDERTSEENIRDLRHEMHALTNAGARMKYAKRLAGGYANGYSPDDADILSNVPGNGTIGGNYHADGGTPVLAEKDEFIMNRISSGVYKKELEAMQRLAYNPSVQPYARNADTSTVMSLSRVSANERQSAPATQQPQGGNVSGTIKVDIPQTITINLSGAGQIGQYDISNIIKRYVDTFMKEAQIRQSFGGFDKENFYNQSTVI